MSVRSVIPLLITYIAGVKLHHDLRVIADLQTCQGKIEVFSVDFSGRFLG